MLEELRALSGPDLAFRGVSIERLDQLPESIQSQIRSLKQDLLPIRRDLREIRRKIREDVDRLGRRLTVINLVAGPCLVVLFAAFVFGMRRRRARQP